MRQAEVDQGDRSDVLASVEWAGLAQLRREDAELPGAGEIVKAACVLFAKELDQPRTRPTR